jgi:hypothetical protein
MDVGASARIGGNSKAASRSTLRMPDPLFFRGGHGLPTQLRQRAESIAIMSALRRVGNRAQRCHGFLPAFGIAAMIQLTCLSVKAAASTGIRSGGIAPCRHLRLVMSCSVVLPC